MGYCPKRMERCRIKNDYGIDIGNADSDFFVDITKLTVKLKLMVLV